MLGKVGGRVVDVVVKGAVAESARGRRVRVRSVEILSLRSAGVADR